MPRRGRVPGSFDPSCVYCQKHEIMGVTYRADCSHVRSPRAREEAIRVLTEDGFWPRKEEPPAPLEPEGPPPASAPLVDVCPR